MGHFTSLTYKKGMYLCVMGELKNYGTISMTARGTYNQAGENVYLWKNSDNSYEYIPAVGGAGGAGVSARVTNYVTSTVHGKSGASGTNRRTGGGGSGGGTVNIFLKNILNLENIVNINVAGGSGRGWYTCEWSKCISWRFWWFRYSHNRNNYKWTVL